MSKPRSFADLWALAKDDQGPDYMNTAPLDQSAPLVAQPNTANAELMWQGNRAVNYNDENRRGMENELATSTARKPAVVTTPDPGSAGGSDSGFGGGGFSGGNATQLGTASDPGTVSAPAAKPPTLPNQA